MKEYIKNNILKNRSFHQRLNHYARLIAGKNIPVIVNDKGESYTDGKRITVSIHESGMNSPLLNGFFKKNEKIPKGFLLGLTAHEAEHVRSSNFDLFAKFQEEVANDLYLNFSINKRIGIKIGSHIMNCVEDGRIERRVCNRYPGVTKYVELINIPIAYECRDREDSDISNLTILLNNFLVLCKANQYSPNLDKDKVDTEIIRLLEECRPLIRKGVSTDSPKMASRYCWQIYEILKFYLYDELKDESQKADEFDDFLNALLELFGGLSPDIQNQTNDSPGNEITISIPMMSTDDSSDGDGSSNDSDKSQGNKGKSTKDDSQDYSSGGNSSSTDDTSEKDSSEDKTPNNNSKDEGDDSENENSSTGASSKEEGEDIEEENSGAGTESEDEDKEDTDNESDSDSNKDSNSDNKDDNADIGNQSEEEKSQNKSEMDNFLDDLESGLKEEEVRELQDVKDSQKNTSMNKMPTRPKVNGAKPNNGNSNVVDLRSNSEYPMEGVLKKQAQSMKRNIEDLLKEKLSEREVNLRRGKLNKRALVDMVVSQKDKVFYKQEVSEIDDYAFYIIIDCSGSMAGTKLDKALYAAALIEGAIKDIAPIKIIGFNSSYTSTKIYTLKDFEDKGKYSLFYSGLSANQGNCDSYALNYAFDDMQNRNEIKKCIFMISDGCPVYSVGNMSPADEVHEISKKIRNSGMHLIPIAISSSGNGFDTDEINIFKKMYDNQVIFKPVQELSKEIIMYIKKMILK